MPDYHTLPEPGTLTVDEAIKAGNQSISRPVRLMIAAGFVAGIGLPLCGLSWWLLPLLVAGSFGGACYYNWWLIPQWRIWAYSGVTDIHQLQRAAELEGLLPRQSFMKAYGFMEPYQRATLEKLQQRFLADAPFVDDPELGKFSISTATHCSRTWPRVSRRSRSMQRESTWAMTSTPGRMCVKSRS